MLPLPRKSDLDPFYLIARPGHRDPTSTTVDDLSKVIQLSLQIIQEEDEPLSITGTVLIIDVGGLTFQHAAQMTPPFVKKALTILQVWAGVGGGREGVRGRGGGGAWVALLLMEGGLGGVAPGLRGRC